MALQPISATHAFTLYHTSATPTLTEVDANAASVDGEPVWQRLETDLDTEENMAAARMPVDSFAHPGLFVLAATVEMPGLTAGWNQFGYPIPGERSIEPALLSIANAYTSLYEYEPASANCPLA